MCLQLQGVDIGFSCRRRRLLSFREKILAPVQGKGRCGKEKELSVHHKLEDLLDEYLQATGLGAEPSSLLFPAAVRKTGKLSRRPLARTDAADILKRRLKQAGLPAHYSPHSFRATGITNFLENDGTLEAAQRIAGTLTAGPRNFMTGAVKRFCSKTSSAFGINVNLKNNARLHVRVQHVGP